MPDLDPPAPPSPLSYRTPAAAPPPRPAWRTVYAYTALTCWAVPLLAGVGIWTASEVVRIRNPAGCQFFRDNPGSPDDPALDRLLVLGAGDVAIGFRLFAVGVFAVLGFLSARWGMAADRFWQVSTPAAIWLGLLASNFVVAAAIFAVMSR